MNNKRSNLLIENIQPFTYIFHNQMNEMRSHDEFSINALNIKLVLTIPILANNFDKGKFIFYFTRNIPIENEDINALRSIIDMVSSIIQLEMKFTKSQQIKKPIYDFLEFVKENYLVIKSNLDLISYSSGMENLFGISINKSKFNLREVIENNEIITEIESFIISDNLEDQFEWIYEENDEKVKYLLTLEKISKLDVILIKFDIHQDLESAQIDETVSGTYNIIPKIIKFRELYGKSPERAFQLAKDEFFPASFAFTVNEEIGPIVLTSSPTMDTTQIMQETIKLMAALNTDQIMTQHYITGTTPWNKPSGELQWIAFAKHNPDARGGLEIHLIGIIIIQNLISIIPNLIQVTLGLLLSGMNTYLGILVEDDADFCTLPYYQDRNFTTIAMIKEMLEELRSTCSELLGAYSMGSMAQ